jgi:uncharacterized protein YukE
MNDYVLRNIVLTAYIVSIGYYLYIYFMITLYKNENNYRCNPLIMIAGKLDGFENTATEFKTCIQDVQPMIYGEITNGYQSMLTDINNVIGEIKDENAGFLEKLQQDYTKQNENLNKNMDILNTNKERMNKKIENTNDTIHSTMNKVNKWIK